MSGERAELRRVEGVLAWTFWPLRDEWPLSLVKLLLLAGIVALFVLNFGALGWLAAALLPLSLARWFLPTACALDAEGLATSFLGVSSRRPWSRFRRYYPHRIGVHLSPFESPTPLDPFRGVFLRFRGNRDEVLAFLEAAGLRKGVRRGSPAPPPEDPAPPPA